MESKESNFHFKTMFLIRSNFIGLLCKILQVFIFCAEVNLTFLICISHFLLQQQHTTNIKILIAIALQGNPSSIHKYTVHLSSTHTKN